LIDVQASLIFVCHLGKENAQELTKISNNHLQRFLFPSGTFLFLLFSFAFVVETSKKNVALLSKEERKEEQKKCRKEKKSL